MSDSTNDPQPVDPPTNTGGGTPSSEPQEPEEAQIQSADPPTNTGGGSGS